MSLKWKGNPAQRVGTGLRDVMREAMAISLEGAEELGQKILRDAKALAPSKTGRLRKSGKMFRTRPKPGRKVPTFYRVKLRFGSKRREGRRSKRAADYAAIVHWDPNARHTNGVDRFLWVAVERHAGKLPAVISRHWSYKSRRFESAWWKSK